jgi:hypothetical protein
LSFSYFSLFKTIGVRAFYFYCHELSKEEFQVISTKVSDGAININRTLALLTLNNSTGASTYTEINFKEDNYIFILFKDKIEF